MNHIETNPLNPIFNARANKNKKKSSRTSCGTANGTADPPQPTSLVNENAQIGVDEIGVVDHAAIIENNP